MKPHDQFAKNYLEELLSLLGRVEISQEITDETRQIDLFPSKNREKGKTLYLTIKKYARDLILPDRLVPQFNRK